ncbi:MAG: carbohydrate kinase family protein [Chloroflexaceae bacterium]|nr:carbohydrate kinase family protein [Chloroflexaceae bacterium]
MRIVVTGSLAYDYIMDFPGYFKDHMLQDKAHMLSVSFLVDSMKRMRGGVAGNIAYNLALLGERPTLLGTVGHDFGEYRARLEAHGIDTSALVEISEVFTSSCFINTDRANNQIVAFYAGAMGRDHERSIVGLNLTPDDLVLISPTSPEAIERFAAECQQHGIPYIFDPGKQSPRLEPEHIRLGLRGAKVLVGNDYEFGMMAKKLDISEAELIASAPITVVTRGEQGSTIYTSATNGQGINIPVAPVHEVRDPTGAGDAYLAGLAYGIARSLPLEVTGRIAALTSAYAIEEKGCQEHNFSRSHFAERYQLAFGAALPENVFSATYEV